MRTAAATPTPARLCPSSLAPDVPLPSVVVRPSRHAPLLRVAQNSLHVTRRPCPSTLPLAFPVAHAAHKQLPQPVPLDAAAAASTPAARVIPLLCLMTSAAQRSATHCGSSRANPIAGFPRRGRQRTHTEARPPCQLSTVPCLPCPALPPPAGPAVPARCTTVGRYCGLSVCRPACSRSINHTRQRWCCSPLPPLIQPMLVLLPIVVIALTAAAKPLPAQARLGPHPPPSVHSSNPIHLLSIPTHPHPHTRILSPAPTPTPTPHTHTSRNTQPANLLGRSLLSDPLLLSTS